MSWCFKSESLALGVMVEGRSICRPVICGGQQLVYYCSGILYGIHFMRHPLCTNLTQRLFAFDVSLNTLCLQSKSPSLTKKSVVSVWDYELTGFFLLACLSVFFFILSLSRLQITIGSLVVIITYMLMPLSNAISKIIS